MTFDRSDFCVITAVDSDYVLQECLAASDSVSTTTTTKLKFAERSPHGGLCISPMKAKVSHPPCKLQARKILDQ